ncbi:MAG: ATP-binding protein [Gammaproteobacteria bacterium]|nr:ATP-binding protein [Gammaproteobacteria bacterium]
MRAWPRSLQARLALTLFSVLLLAQLAATAIQLADRAEVFYRAVGVPLAQSLAGTVTRLEALPPEHRQARLPRFTGPLLRLALLPEPTLDATNDAGWRGTLLVRLLRREVGARRPLRVALADTPDLAPMTMHGSRLPHDRRGPGFRRHMAAMGLPPEQGVWIKIEMELDDGRWLAVERHLPRELFVSPLRLMLSLAVLLVAVLGVTLLAVRWLTRPLDRLARAADTLGRDLDQPPLDDSGPDEMRRAARAFNTMQARLQRLVNDRARLLAAISHDLKTPLTRLRLRGELVDDPELRARFAADVDEMIRLVETTLDFVRDAAGDEPVADLDIDALVCSLQADYEDTGRHVDVTGHAETPYPGRARALRRALANLVDNALAYGGSATVAIDDRPERIELCVVDRGPGLPEEALERMLEPFQRGEASRSRETGGSGLGLAIVRDIARVHGGELTLANRRGGGLRARISLPR